MHHLMCKTRIASFRSASENIGWFQDRSDNGEWCMLSTYKYVQNLLFYRKKRISLSYNDMEGAL